MFTNIPEGVSYEVEETQANGYDAPAYKVNTKEVNTGTIVGGKTDEAIITICTAVPQGTRIPTTA